MLELAPNVNWLNKKHKFSLQYSASVYHIYHILKLII